MWEFDPNQGNYILELSSSYRETKTKTEVTPFFRHVSRHLSDRPKVVPVAWNVAGIRVLRQTTFRKATIDLVADLGATTQQVNVDYHWLGNADVVVRRPVAPRAELFAHGTGRLATVTDPPALPGRQTQAGGVVEGGVRLVGEAAVGELFAGFERRFDAYPLGFAAEQWFMVGFRVVRR